MTCQFQEESLARRPCGDSQNHSCFAQTNYTIIQIFTKLKGWMKPPDAQAAFCEKRSNSRCFSACLNKIGSTCVSGTFRQKDNPLDYFVYPASHTRQKAERGEGTEVNCHAKKEAARRKIAKKLWFIGTLVRVVV